MINGRMAFFDNVVATAEYPYECQERPDIESCKEAVIEIVSRHYGVPPEQVDTELEEQHDVRVIVVHARLKEASEVLA